MMLPPCFTVRMVPGFLQTWPLAFRPMSSILVSSDQRILFLLQRWLFFWKVLPSPQRNSIRVNIRFLVTTLTKALLPRVFSLAGRPALGRVLVVPNFFHLRMMEGGHCVLGDLQCCINVLVPFPRCVPRHNPVSELYEQFLWPHGLVFALTCTVNCGIIDRCAFPSHVQSIEFTTGELQSSCRNISWMINGNRMCLSSISSLIVKGLNTYVNKVSVFDFFYAFAKKI